MARSVVKCWCCVSMVGVGIVGSRSFVTYIPFLFLLNNTSRQIMSPQI